MRKRYDKNAGSRHRARTFKGLSAHRVDLRNGVEGVMIPMANAAAEARAVLGCMKYCPDARQVAKLGAARDNDPRVPVPAKLSGAAKRTKLFSQIETATGAKTAVEVASADGVDCLQAGRFDLFGYSDYVREPRDALNAACKASRIGVKR